MRWARGRATSDIRGGRRLAVPAGAVLSYRPVRPSPRSGAPVTSRFIPAPRTSMARSCAICGKVSMGGFNPQSSGMNRVRAHRRYQPNLQPFTIVKNGAATKAARLHALSPHRGEVRQVAPSLQRPTVGRSSGVRPPGSPTVPGRFPFVGATGRSAIRGVQPDRERAVVDQLDRHHRAEPARRDLDAAARGARPRTGGRAAPRAPGPRRR